MDRYLPSPLFFLAGDGDRLARNVVESSAPFLVRRARGLDTGVLVGIGAVLGALGVACRLALRIVQQNPVVDLLLGGAVFVVCHLGFFWLW
ncbi:hypothetical protein F4818DRAFT_400352 [Hypoxylon cercidicola]|nr:hypothetical protein F4818DRAFT_400352 [Hypoxylon cercidicola]